MIGRHRNHAIHRTGTAQYGIDRALFGRAARESGEIEALSLDLFEVQAERGGPQITRIRRQPVTVMAANFGRTIPCSRRCRSHGRCPVREIVLTDRLLKEW